MYAHRCLEPATPAVSSRGPKRMYRHAIRPPLGLLDMERRLLVQGPPAQTPRRTAESDLTQRPRRRHSPGGAGPAAREMGDPLSGVSAREGLSAGSLA